MLEKGEIDAAVVAKTSEEVWKPKPFIATKKEDVLAAAGSKYTQCPSVLGVGDALELGYKNVAFVGLPCHIQGMRKVQSSKGFDIGAERVKLLIGLFCTETFDMSMLTKMLGKLSTRMDEVEKFDVKEGSFIIFTGDGRKIKMPIRELQGCAREACNYCLDFAAEFAEVSVGSIGSELGWSTVIIRSEAGKESVKSAEEKGVIETKKLAEERIKEVRNLASFKKKKNLKKIYDKAEPIRILNMLVEPEMLKRFLSDD